MRKTHMWIGRWKKLVTGRMQIALIGIAFIVAAYAFSLPENIFNKPYSTVLEARDGRLLSASIAGDGQWRFPPDDSIPTRFAEALIAFEDKRFYYHPGVDLLSLGRAMVQNVREGEIVSGGSTITMQVIRLSRESASRSVFQKCIEIILATRLELSYSKHEILSLYASHAPFGGNVVGLDAACWRYFGRGPGNLSWGEAALLAVLPNAPSLIHPGKNRDLLRAKRDNLLDKLHLRGRIDSLTCALAKAEPIPDKPQVLPRSARHLLARVKKEGHGEKKVLSTIDYPLQRLVEERLQQYHERLRANQIYNGAVLILDVKTGSVLAYAGNVELGSGRRGEEVDIITSPRSTGSILKPFLFAAAMDEGLILPQTLLPDIPVMMNGFSPDNFSREFDGAVPAGDALVRSLNVPAVFLLKDYRYEKFFSLLKHMGMTTLDFNADHYGLSLILGGAEGSLWDITGMYASMARTLNNYFHHPGTNRYNRADFHSPAYMRKTSTTSSQPLEEASWLSASSIYLTFQTLRELYRPAEETGWRYFNTSKTIAWKTGTSFGFRDAWAVGVNGDYAVGVWIGNADGEGRAGLTGTTAAAPLLFDIFSLLPGQSWFRAPRSEMTGIVTCRKSGYRASSDCEQTDTLYVARPGLRTRACPHHKTIHVSRDAKFQVHADCADLDAMLHLKWFVLPPIQEHYFRKKNISYKPLPPLRFNCQGGPALPSMDLVYPEPDARILIPRDFSGKPGHSIFELAHRQEDAAVFWHLDGAFIGTTRGSHRMALSPGEGNHILTLVDENGLSLEEHFTVISGL